MQKLSGMNCAFPDLFKLFQIILTIPVSSAGAERSFSTMKRVKSYLRSTVASDRLNNLSILSKERELSAELIANPNIVIDNFVKISKR